MARIFIALIVAALVSGPAWANYMKLNFKNVSKLPIHAYENDDANANMIAILGGVGLKNKRAKVKIFSHPEINIYKFKIKLLFVS